jgi:hypothetical protein
VLHPCQCGHPHGGITLLRTGCTQRVVVKRGAAVCQKATEATSHNRAHLLLVQPGAALDLVDPAVREVVTTERKPDRYSRADQPWPGHASQRRADVGETGQVRHPDYGGQLQRGREQYE